MSAAKQQDFPLAIRYFTDARKAAPDSTSVLFNLALAEAQVPGRELRAVCWFENYLALAPDADNAAAVRKQINDLEVRAEGNVGRIVNVMKTLAGKFPAGDNSGISALTQTAGVQAESGDMDGANATLDTLPADSRDNARASVAGSLAGEGMFDAAKTMAGSIGYDQPNKTSRSSAFKSIADAQIYKGLYADARQSLASISDPYQHLQLIQSLATVLFYNGNVDDAMALLAEAKQTVANNTGRDAYNTMLLLQTLAATEAHLGLQTEAAATLKPVDAKLPAKASLNNNAAIENAFSAHLQAFDYAGARALIPRLIDAPGFKYKTEAIRSLNNATGQNVADQLSKISSLDLPKLETALSMPSMDPVVRIWGWSTLARLCKNGGQPEKLPDIFQQATAAFASVGNDPPAKPVAANWVADIAELAGMPPEAEAWRLKAVLLLDPLIKNGAQKIDNLSNLYNAQTYALAAEGIIARALSSSDDRTIRAALDAAGRDLPKCDDFRQYMLASAVLHHYWKSDNYEAAAVFIKSIPVEKLRQEAMNMQLQYQFQSLLAMAKLPEAARALGQITDIPPGSYTYLFAKPSIPALRVQLANAYADAGDWAGAEKTADTISDPVSRKAAVNYLASQRAQGEFDSKQSTAAVTARWHEQQASLSLQSQPSGQLDIYWQLCNSPIPDLLEEQRKLMPDYFSTALAVAKPYGRSDGLNYAATAAQSLGLFEMERHAQASGFSAIQAGSVTSWYSGFLNRGSIADCLEQSSILWHDGILLIAIDRLKADGNPAAAAKMVDQLTSTDESLRNRILMSLWIAQGNLGEARTAFNKIQKDSSANNYAKSWACDDLVDACIKAGDVASAKSAVEENRKLMDNETLVSRAIVAVALAGEPDWAAEQAKSISYESTRDEALSTIAGVHAAHSQDAAAVKSLLKSSQVPASFIDAMINAGNPQLALQLIPEISDSTQRQNETAAAATALAHSGDAAAAKKAVETLTGNPRRFSTRCQIAYEQARQGDVDGAKATLVEARKLDPRTSKDFDMDTWVNMQIFYWLQNKGDSAGAQAIVQKIQDPGLRDSLFQSAAYDAMQKKDFAAMQSALASITNPATRSSVAYSLCRSENDPGRILALLDQITDLGYQAVALSCALNKAISLGNLATVLPRITALPDGAAKAYLLSDVLRAQVYMGLDTGNTSVLPLALKALAAMPPDVWHTLLLCDFVRLAQQGSPSQAEILKTHAATEAQALEGADAKIWRQFLADADAAKVEEQKAAAAPPATASGGSADSPATAWANYVDYNLKDTLSTDFKSALEGAASSTPGNSGNQAWTVFSNVSQLASQLLRKLKDIHDLRVKFSAPAKL